MVNFVVDSLKISLCLWFWESHLILTAMKLLNIRRCFLVCKFIQQFNEGSGDMRPVVEPPTTRTGSPKMTEIRGETPEVSCRSVTVVSVSRGVIPRDATCSWRASMACEAYRYSSTCIHISSLRLCHMWAGALCGHHRVLIFLSRKSSLIHIWWATVHEPRIPKVFTVEIP